MKFINILFLYLTLSLISVNFCGLLSRTTHRFKITMSNKASTRQAQNKWYQLFIGFVLGAAGQSEPGDVAKINECIPPEWQAADSDRIPTDIANPKNKSAFDKVLNIVGKAVKFVCAFKDKLFGLFRRKYRKALRRNKYRMFFENKVTMYRRNKGSMNKGFDIRNKLKNKVNKAVNTATQLGNKAVNTAIKVENKAVNTATKVGNKAINTGKKVGNKAINTGKKAGKKVKDAAKKVGKLIMDGAKEVGDWLKEGWEKVKSLGVTFVKQIKSFINRVQFMIRTYFTSSTAEKIKRIILCGKKFAEVAKGIGSIITGIIGKVALITSIAGHNYIAIAQLIIGLICNYKLFILAFQHFKAAISETDTLKKFGYVGKFIGTLLRAMVTKK